MSLLTLADVRKSYRRQEVLNGVSLVVAPGHRVGLIGANGAGKTTILRIAGGEEAPDSGRVTLQPNTRVARLSQEPLAGDSRIVLDATQRPTAELQHLWAELTALEEQALHETEALARYDLLHHRFQDAGGYELGNRAREVLAGLGLPESCWGMPVSTLSGGERTRLALAQILVRQPDLLLLDEPTNHIDWRAAEWLQEYLKRCPGAALIVSHDRFFLDQVTEETIALEQGRTRTYSGNYSAFVAKRAAELQQQAEALRRQQEEIRREEAIVQRLRSHRKFASMHSRERVLDRLKAEQIESPPGKETRLKVRPGRVARTGREVLSVRDLAAGYGERALFSGLNLTLERGERLAIVGPNGAGKTTLLRALAGELAPLRGSVTLGYQVHPAYFAQDLSLLDPEQTVFEGVWSTGALDFPETMQALHQFLFVGDALEKQVAALSGGERTRLALCRLLAGRPNLLLLDEPTNHLDLPSREAVEAALRSYPGAAVIVSHDRYLLSAVATRLLEIDGGRHRLFADGYERYRQEVLRPDPMPAVRRTAPHPRRRPESPARRVAKLEAEIARLEARQLEVTALLSDAATWMRPGASALGGEYDTLGESLRALYAEWEEAAAAAAAADRR